MSNALAPFVLFFVKGAVAVSVVGSEVLGLSWSEDRKHYVSSHTP